MQRFSSRGVLVALFVVLFALNLGGHVPARNAANARQPVSNQPLGDLAPFRNIAADALAMVDGGDLARARTRVKTLESCWDKAEAKLRLRNPGQWQSIDRAIDAAIMDLRADQPQMAASKEALQNLLGVRDRPALDAAATQAVIAAARLSAADIITAAENSRAGASVLDVSFEPKDGRPLYAVRTYANGKVWDGLVDAASGAVIDQGTVVDESALDTEDKAELAGLKSAKVTLRQAIASAENAHGGRALNAGLEQVRGRAVWEILMTNTAQSQLIHIDPVSGRIL